MLRHRLTFSAPQQVAVVEGEISTPPAGQVLIRTLATLISTGTELTAFSGDFPPDSAWARYVKYPWSAGYSNVGEVVEVGAGVSNVRVGDRVISYAPHCDYAHVRAADAQKIPDGVSAEEASFCTIAHIVLNGVRLSETTLGEAVVLVGLGLLGQMAVQFTRLCGGFPILAVDVAEKRLEWAKRFGATHTLCAPVAEAEPAIADLTKGRKADVAFEITGNPQVIPPLLKLVRRLGRVILLGSPRGPCAVDFHDEVHSLGLRIIGAHNSTHPPTESPNTPWTRPRHNELFLDLLSAGTVSVKDLITHRYPWRQAQEAYDMLLADRAQALGVVFEW